MTGRPVRLAAGTTNPVKLDAIRQATSDALGEVDVLAVPVASDVPDQPWGDDQTASGALARASAAIRTSDAEYGVGLESGLVEGPGERVYVVSWAAVIDRSGRVGFGGSERFALPGDLEPRLRAGEELGPLLDDAFGRPGLARQAGAVGIFTSGRRTRADILAVAVLHALIALLEPWREPRDARSDA